MDWIIFRICAILKLPTKGKQMFKFEIGQEVIATTDSQKLKKGATYLVSNIVSDSTPWGSYVEYHLSGAGAEDGLLVISNGHILLQAA